jgi:tetratricopeptide (TPR) repeat protein
MAQGESENFIVYMDDRPNDVRRLSERLERFNYVMRTLQNVAADPSPVKLRVFVVRSTRRVQSLLDGRAGENTTGIYIPTTRGPYTIVPERTQNRGRFSIRSEEILFHEYAHHFMLQYYPANYPGWYVEGFAEFWSMIRLRPNNRVELGRPASGRAPDLHLSPWIRTSDILQNEAPLSSMLYAQAWLLTHYAFFDRDTGALLRRYLNRMQEGATAPAAYVTTFGLSGVDYDDVLQDYRDGRMSGMAFDLPNTPDFPVTLTEISDEEAEIALLYPRATKEGLLAAEELVRRYPDNPQAHVELARFRIEDGNIPGALEAADHALALSPEHLEAHLYKGIALTEAAMDSADDDDPRWAEARDHIARANRADPDNALALYSFYRAYPNDGQRPEIVDQALEVAYSSVPQSPEVRSAMVNEMINQERYDIALQIIVPLLTAQHGAGADPNAEAMLASLRQYVNEARRESEAEGSPDETGPER